MGAAIDTLRADPPSRRPNLTPIASLYDVGVIGLGRIGRSVAEIQARRGKTVAGFDTRAAAVDAARAADIAAFEAPSRAQVHILCVPADALERAVDAVLDVLDPGNAVIVATPVSPGTTRRVVGRRCRERGFEPGRDVFVAFAPTAHTVGGLTDACTERIAAFFETTVERTRPSRPSSPASPAPATAR